MMCNALSTGSPPTVLSPPPPIDRHQLTTTLASCTTMDELKQIHSQFIKVGLADDNDAIGRVVKFCASSDSGSLEYALQVFDKIPRPDSFIWNTLIRGHLQSGLDDSCINLYSKMVTRSVTPNRYTFPPVVQACCSVHRLEEGKQVHAHVFKHGLASDLYAQNNLVHLYTTCGELDGARRLFDKMDERDVVSWTTMFSGYAKCGRVDEARLLFDEMPVRNSVSWNAMIAAYVQNGRFQEAFALFERMQAEIGVDKYAAATMLSACTSLGALDQGKWIHACIEKSGIELDMKLATSVIDMYCKCGCLEKAFEVFRGLPKKGISSWNCMISGLAVHGQGRDALDLFNEMEEEMVTPDYITFVAVLNACAHAGLVQEGRYYFDYMTRIYAMKPKMEHYGCMVDLLGRAGLQEEAKDFIDKMPMKPDAGVLGALFGACTIHGNVKLGEVIGKQVIELEPHNSGRYILLANLYASVGRWDDVASVRKMMSDRGVSKPPGCSMIELNGAVHEFIAGDRAHPQSREIYSMLTEMSSRLRSAGYVPETKVVLHDLSEDEKESPLHYHSEKLAIAFGLLHTRSGDTIRITKNLRVCPDCHSATKLISKLFDREIIVRDRNRFHHFREGNCSCKDYW
ncbi:Pentatricopeptide repeat-containing protein [Nymphaea thermarum]|nr:Pentatricopeptide repeat-containing protein [Nymphaea thermarum]